MRGPGSPIPIVDPGTEAVVVEVEVFRIRAFQQAKHVVVGTL